MMKKKQGYLVDSLQTFIKSLKSISDEWLILTC